MAPSKTLADLLAVVMQDPAFLRATGCADMLAELNSDHMPQAQHFQAVPLAGFQHEAHNYYRLPTYQQEYEAAEQAHAPTVSALLHADPWRPLG
jgi:hypothetical protein